MGECKIQFADPEKTERIPCVIYECNKVTQLIVYPNEEVLVRLKLEGEYEGFWKTNYSVEFEFSTEEMELSTSSWSVEKGDILLTRITSKETGSFSILVKVDNKEASTISVLSKEKEKDTFSETEKDNLLQENRAAVAFKRSGEASGAYCINAADRGLGALLNNTTDFYNEHNRIGLHNSSSRGTAFEELGHVHSFFELKTNNYNTDNEPTALESSLKTQIERDINDKIGYHVYYFSMHGEVHVMLLLVDNTNPCDKKFRILDQGFIGRDYQNFVSLETIDDDFLQLAKRLWNLKLNGGISIKQYAKEILMWKIQRNA